MMDVAKRKRLHKSLEKALEQWCGDQSETEDWVDSYIGKQLHTLMTEAALAVLLCTEDTSAYLRREGMLDES